MYAAIDSWASSNFILLEFSRLLQLKGKSVPLNLSTLTGDSLHLNSVVFEGLLGK